MSFVRKNMGFTLIEVTFAVLIVGLGLLTFFSLFPSGLRMAEQDLADTKCGLFSDMVVSGLHANAAKMKSAGDWVAGSFEYNIQKEVLGVGVNVAIGGTNNYSFDENDGVRYCLTVLAPTNVTLNVWYGLYGSLSGILPVVSTYSELYEYNLVK